jgi:RNA polymerase sigma-70 factor (ECF subfamily)
MDEAGLIQDAAQGDLNAFNRLVLAYQDMLYSHAYRIMGEPDAAEDATQEAMISAFKHINSFRGGSFKAWLLRIVTNSCYDELRRRKRKPTTPLEPLDSEDEEIESPYWMTDQGEQPEQAAERGELGNAIQDCLNQLAEDFRLIVILVDVQGLDYQEASDVAGVPLGTIKSRLARARLRLRECLQGFWELLPDVFRLGDESL